MELMQIIHGQISYSLNLYKKLLSMEQGNVVASPLSISAALAITAGGARGETLNQMVSHLKFLDNKKLPLHTTYQNLIREYYRAESSAVDFGTQAEWARGQVNLWASQKTRGKINELLPPGSVKSSTTMILANALYFF
ncbi:hypothetical protein R1flu_014928 [Riccia fluitans]|uniref:Serpin domain-containing protein n=1 Tax=Riccia fluitans TaxID=41844 RepID=A0ABD1YHM4_9MARC